MNKLILIFYGTDTEIARSRMRELASVLADNLGVNCVSYDRLHQIIHTRNCTIRLVTYEDVHWQRLRGIRADECFGFGTRRDEFVKAENIGKPYTRTVLEYVMAVENEDNGLTARPVEEIRRDMPEWFKGGKNDEKN